LIRSRTAGPTAALETRYPGGMDPSILPFAPTALAHRMWEVASTMQQVAETMERSARTMERAQTLAARSQWLSGQVAAAGRAFRDRAARRSRY
jgi:hypothetical protein